MTQDRPSLEMSALKRPGVYSRRQKHAMTTTNKGTDKARSLGLTVSSRNERVARPEGHNAQDSTTKRTRRRRHDYSPEIADLICDRIAGGASLRQICQDTTMPARSTIFVWLEEHEDFARSYALARQIQIEDLMDEILEIADDSSNDWIDREGPDGKKYRVFNPDSIRRSKLRIGARKWLISKLMPKRYSWK
jgi:hypothetical protein